MKQSKRKTAQRQTAPEKTGSEAAVPERRAQEKTARECALFLLEYADRTEAQLRQKLREREYPADEIEDTLQFLKEYHYIDDAAYAERYVRSASSRKSARQITAALEQKGVDRALIECALAEQPVDEESQICAFLQKKGYRPGECMEPDQYRRIMGSLARRGYSYDRIRKVMSGFQDSYFGEN